MLMLKPHGFVLATGLDPLVSEIATHVSEFLRLCSEPNRLMSLMQELLSKVLSGPPTAENDGARHADYPALVVHRLRGPMYFVLGLGLGEWWVS